MKPILLDTDTFSEVLKGRNPNVRHHAGSYLEQFGSFTVSAITVIEIIKGLARNRPDLPSHPYMEVLDQSIVLKLDRQAAGIAGQIMAELERTGQMIGWADPLIAGIAIRHGCILATGNTKHFQRVIELGFPLTLVNWRDDPTPIS